MVRFDFSSAAVVALAVASSLSAAFWLNHLGHNGEARAAPAHVAPAPAASGDPAQVTTGPRPISTGSPSASWSTPGPASWP